MRALAVQLSRTEERERKRLATDLHDNLAQLLALTKMKLEAAQQAPANRWPTFNEVRECLDQALTYTRTLLSELSPPLLGDKNDLQTAIAWVVKKMRRHGLHVTIRDDGSPKALSEELLTVAYQAIHELLFNVLKHAQTKEAVVLLNRAGENLEAVVMDQGVGFDVAASAAREVRPDVILRDVNMPKMNGVQATRQITAEFPEITVIGLSMNDDPKIELAMREAGAAGYLSKGEAGEKLVDAIREAWKLRMRSRLCS